MRIEQINEIERYWTSHGCPQIANWPIGTQYKVQVPSQNDKFIPGPPQNVRISSKRLPEVLKIRWMPPS